MSDKFDYLKYAALSWAHAPIYPYLPNTKTMNIVDSPTKTVTITMLTGDTYEFVMVVPGNLTGTGTSVVNAVTILGAKNPTDITSYNARYSTEQLLNTVLTTPNDMKMLIAASVKVSATTQIGYKVCKYAKSDLSVADTMNTIETIVPTFTGVIEVGKSLYLTNHGHILDMSSSGNMSSIQRHAPLTFYLCRLTNSSGSTTSLTLQMKCTTVGPQPTMPALINNNKIPMSFSLYVLDQLRLNNDIKMLGDGEIDAAKEDIIVSIHNSITNLAQKWYDFTKNINTNPNILTNFMVYYLH